MENEKLTLEQFSAYLPYGGKGHYGRLKYYASIFLINRQDVLWKTKTDSEILSLWDNLGNAKLILRPMADVESYFENLFETDKDVQTYLNDDFLAGFDVSINELHMITPEFMPYGTLKVLLKHHFDVFELIGQRLAVSIHDVS